MLIYNKNLQKEKKKRWIFNLKKATEEDWKKFSQQTEEKFTKYESLFARYINSQEINKAWEIIKEIILETANSIFGKKYLNTRLIRSKQGVLAHKLEALVTKIIKKMENNQDFSVEIETWRKLKKEDADQLSNSTQALSMAKEFRKNYRKEKYIWEYKHQE